MQSSEDTLYTRNDSLLKNERSNHDNLTDTTVTLNPRILHDKPSLNKSSRSSVVDDTTVKIELQNKLKLALNSIEEDTIAFSKQKLHSMRSKGSLNVIDVPVQKIYK